jgi:hypothetical protein
MRPPTLSAGPTFALRVPMATFSPSKRSDPLPGIQASGAIVFASIFMLLGLGVGGLLGLHAYVHRSDPPVLLIEIPAGSTVPRQEPPPVGVECGIHDRTQRGGPARKAGCGCIGGRRVEDDATRSGRRLVRQARRHRSPLRQPLSVAVRSN